MLRTTLLLSWVAMAPCGGTGSPPDAPLDTTHDAPGRSYLLASSGVELDPVRGPVVDDPALASDVDVVNIHQDFFGVPWTAFAAGAAPPAAWADAMRDLAQGARATGKPVFLALAPLDGDRAYLAPDAVASDTGFTVLHGWTPRCYDLATAADGSALRRAYSRYVEYMVGLFQPRWTNVAIEVNLFHLACAGAWDGMVALERDAYDAAKRVAPDVPAFPSIQIDALYGRAGCPTTADQCYEAEYAAILPLARDRFAISTYPYRFLGFDRPEDIPADYLWRAAARGDEQLVIAETGWLATDLVATDENARCATVLADDPMEQARYLDRVLGDAAARGSELVTWISHRDFLAGPVMTDCPCTFSAPWCELVRTVRGDGDAISQRDAEVGFKAFGTMGIRDHDGAPRAPIFERWTQARALPAVPSP